MPKTIVITGATSGIGMYTAIGLAQTRATVVVIGRDEARGKTGVASIQRASGSEDVHLVVGDLASLAEVAKLADAIRARCPRIDVLINNAGSAANAYSTTSDGLEFDFGVNVAAPYALTRALLPALEAAKPARVINVTGGSARGAVDMGNLGAEKGFVGLTVYDNSKRAMEAMSLALAVEFAPRGVFVNVVYPGQASTSMTRSMALGSFPWWMRPFFPLWRWMTADDGGTGAEKASRSSVWAAKAPDLEGVSGAYFGTDCRRAELHATVRDPANQQQIVGLIERASGARG